MPETIGLCFIILTLPVPELESDEFAVEKKWLKLFALIAAISSVAVLWVVRIDATSPAFRTEVETPSSR